MLLAANDTESNYETVNIMKITQLTIQKSKTIEKVDLKSRVAYRKISVSMTADIESDSWHKEYDLLSDIVDTALQIETDKVKLSKSF